MGYKDIINNLKPYDYSQYMDITSNEKLMCLAVLTLVRNNVPLTFNYICIATYKLFPDKFCFDEEFKEYPNGEKLNRTLMHLKYVNKKNTSNVVPPYVTGTPEEGYNITSRGKNTALEAEAIINHTQIDTSVKAPAVDLHKKGFSKDYLEFTSSDGFKKYLDTKKVDLMHIWEFFNVIPFTELKRIKMGLNNIKCYAENENDNDCITYVDKVLKMI